MFKALVEPFQYPKSKPSPAVEEDRTQEGSHPSGRKTKAKVSLGTLRILWGYLAQSKGRLTVVLSLVFVSSVLALLGPFLIGMAVDDFLMTNSGGNLLHYLIALGLVFIFHSISVFLQNYWMIGIAQNTVYTMRVRLFEHLHKLPIPFFVKRQQGELMSRVTNDIDNVSSTLNSSVIQIFSSVLTLIGTLSVMLWLSPLLTLITFLIVPSMFFGMRWITRRTGRLFKELQRNLGDLNGYIEETISGQRIVKAFSQEQKAIAEFREKNERYRTSGFWAQTFTGFIPKLMNMLNNLSFALIAGIGGVLAIKHIITVGTIVIFVEYSRQFTRPLNDLANQFNTLLSAIAGAERVFDIMNEEVEEVDESDARDLPALVGDVVFSGVGFSYDKGGDTLSDISFQAAVGQTIAFVGPTGAGKTTLIHLLARFYDANSGSIYIDGHDISEIKRSSLRRHMAFVLQDPFLFQGTIRENIRYGKLDARDDEVVQAAKHANAHSFIMRLPDGYDTVLMNDGGGISQGQKQLLSIARAILADPAILVLDEATSSIDTVTEINIQEALQRLMQGRTSFVIAHRLNTIQKADKIIVIRDGRIVESGTHEQLLMEKGFYEQLYNSQLTVATA